MERKGNQAGATGGTAAKEARTSYRLHLQGLDVDELDNEDYTYTHEAHWLDMSDDEVADRILDIESEKARRMRESL